jgi:putative nucleotidyltransferase with HDIG domain
MLSGLIALIVMTGSLPFWEAAFDAVTPIKLLELTNPNQPILKRLITEAPGTYHHSIIVANLSEMAAMDIGADGALARAGSYYHDIGKLKYPNYFSENQAGENPHDYLLPLDSANIIIEHVQIGHAYAIDEKLPKAVRDIIIQHHGTTLVKYFYYKAKKDFPTEDIKQEHYRYPGIIPQCKEAAIVMLADTVEAAVRSMFNKGKTIDEIKLIVEDLIKDKLNDGQLLDSGLTIKDISTIQQAFIKVFKGMYHERIAYPKEAIKEEKLSDTKEKE